MSDGIVKKLLTPITWPIPADFRELGAACPEGKSLLIAMIAAPSLESFHVALAGRGAVTYEAPSREGPGETPLYEYCWNHTTLHMLKRDRGVTYLQCLFPHDRLMPLVKEMVATFGDEVLHHLEFSRYAGHVTASALPIVRYKSRERLYEIIAAYEAAGVMIANPHVYTLEDGSRYRRADADQLGFKAEVDPYGLLNPGKMRSYVPAKWELVSERQDESAGIPSPLWGRVREGGRADLSKISQRPIICEVSATPLPRPSPTRGEGVRRANVSEDPNRTAEAQGRT